MVKSNNSRLEHPSPEGMRRRRGSQLPLPGDLNQEAEEKYWSGSELSSQPLAELERLLRKVQRRLKFHRDMALTLAAVRGAIETELLRREAP
jgi:hypothetical protein